MPVKIEIDMKMPKSCASCRFCVQYDEEKTKAVYRDKFFCEILGCSFWVYGSINNKEYDKERFILCPLKPCNV